MPLPSVEFLKSFRNTSHIFVETGSHQGDGIQMALDADFLAIYSTDVSAYAYGYCCGRFRDQRTVVNLFNLDSRIFLEQFLSHLTARAVFWIDSHWCNTDGGRQEDVPLMEELTIMRKQELTGHTLLIDDVRLFGTDHYPNLKRVVSKIMAMNPGYVISFHDGLEFKNDILVAKI